MVRLTRRVRSLALPGVPAVATALVVAAAAAALATVPAFADAGGSGISPLLPDADSPNGKDLYNLYNLISIPAILIFLLVEGLLIALIVKFRRSRRPAGFIPPQWHGSTALEITWTVIPFLIITAIGVLSYQELAKDFVKRTDAETQMNITVTGYQFGWQYDYQEDGVTVQSVGQNATPMVVPVNRVIRLKVDGRDVIHSFWVPYLMGKTDAVPGYDNFTWMQPQKVGEYHGQCAELCGAGHNTMQIVVRVVSQADYDRWVAEQKAAAKKQASPKPSPSTSASPGPAASASPAAAPTPSPSPS